MKKYTILILSLLLVLFSCSKTFKNEREANGYKGKVKSVSILRSRYMQEIDEWKAGKAQLRGLIYFKKNGVIIKKMRARRGKKQLNSIKYTYTKNWKRLKTSVYNKNNQLLAYGLYKYDKQMRRIKSTWHKKDGVIVRKIRYSYPSQNRRKLTLYNKDNSIKLYVIRINNGQGLRVASEWYNAQNKIIRKRTYSYKFDQFGNWIKRTTFRETTKKGKKITVPRSLLIRKIVYYK